MKKQWNKDIHDRLKDFPKKAPEGLLDAQNPDVRIVFSGEEITDRKSVV